MIYDKLKEASEELSWKLKKIGFDWPTYSFWVDGIKDTGNYFNYNQIEGVASSPYLELAKMWFRYKGIDIYVTSWTDNIRKTCRDGKKYEASINNKGKDSKFDYSSNDYDECLEKLLLKACELYEKS